MLLSLNSNMRRVTKVTKYLTRGSQKSFCLLNRLPIEKPMKCDQQRKRFIRTKCSVTIQQQLISTMML